MIESPIKVRHPDPDICRLIATAINWFDQLGAGEDKSVKEIADREKVFDMEITRVLPLAFLAPSIFEDILEGRHPKALTVKSLKRISPLSTDWNKQRTWLGFNQYSTLIYHGLGPEMGRQRRMPIYGFNAMIKCPCALGISPEAPSLRGSGAN